MGNKNTSPHLTKTNGHEHHRYTEQQHNLTNNDNSFEISSNQNNNGKKYGQSPRIRRRSTKQGKKSQVYIKR